MDCLLRWSRGNFGRLIEGGAERLYGQDMTEWQLMIAYLGLWSDKNIPDSSNGGRIPNDHHVYRGSPEFDPYDPLKVDLATRQRDLAMRCMIKWLASDDGQTFIAACERNLKIKREVKTASFHSQNGSWHMNTPVQKWLAAREMI